MPNAGFIYDSTADWQRFTGSKRVFNGAVKLAYRDTASDLGLANIVVNYRFGQNQNLHSSVGATNDATIETAGAGSVEFVEEGVRSRAANGGDPDSANAGAIRCGGPLSGYTTLQSDPSPAPGVVYDTVVSLWTRFSWGYSWYLWGLYHAYRDDRGYTMSTEDVFSMLGNWQGFNYYGQSIDLGGAWRSSIAFQQYGVFAPYFDGLPHHILFHLFWYDAPYKKGIKARMFVDGKYVTEEHNDGMDSVLLGPRDSIQPTILARSYSSPTDNGTWGAFIIQGGYPDAIDEFALAHCPVALAEGGTRYINPPWQPHQQVLPLPKRHSDPATLGWDNGYFILTGPVESGTGGPTTAVNHVRATAFILPLMQQDGPWANLAAYDWRCAAFWDFEYAYDSNNPTPPDLTNRVTGTIATAVGGGMYPVENWRLPGSQGLYLNYGSIEYQVPFSTRGTLACWFRRSSYGHLVGFSDASGPSGTIGDGPAIYVKDNGHVEFKIRCSLYSRTQNCSFDMPMDGDWHHVAATWEPGFSAKLYIDGVLQDDKKMAMPALTQTIAGNPYLWIGGQCPEAPSGYGSAVDNVAYYTDALSADAIADLAQGGMYPSRPAKGLAAQYYSPSSGQYVFRIDPNLDFTYNWGGPGPDPSLDNSNFSVIWQGKLVVPATDDYTFFMEYQDRMRLVIDGRTILESTNAGSNSQQSDPITLGAGEHDIRVEWAVSSSSSTMKLYWETATMSRQVIPASHFRPMRFARPMYANRAQVAARASENFFAATDASLPWSQWYDLENGRIQQIGAQGLGRYVQARLRLYPSDDDRRLFSTGLDKLELFQSQDISTTTAYTTDFTAGMPDWLYADRPNNWSATTGKLVSKTDGYGSIAQTILFRPDIVWPLKMTLQADISGATSTFYFVFGYNQPKDFYCAGAVSGKWTIARWDGTNFTTLAQTASPTPAINTTYTASLVLDRNVVTLIVGGSPVVSYAFPSATAFASKPLGFGAKGGSSAITVDNMSLAISEYGSWQDGTSDLPATLHVPDYGGLPARIKVYARADLDIPARMAVYYIGPDTNIEGKLFVRGRLYLRRQAPRQRAIRPERPHRGHSAHRRDRHSRPHLRSAVRRRGPLSRAHRSHRAIQHARRRGPAVRAAALRRGTHPGLANRRQGPAGDDLRSAGNPRQGRQSHRLATGPDLADGHARHLRLGLRALAQGADRWLSLQLRHRAGADARHELALHHRQYARHEHHRAGQVVLHHRRHQRGRRDGAQGGLRGLVQPSADAPWHHADADKWV